MQPTTASRRRPSFWGCLPAMAALGTLAVLNLGTVRITRQADWHFEWQNGWPFVFVSRQAGIDPAQGSRDAWVAREVLSFSPSAAFADGLTLACISMAVCLVARRRGAASRRPQFGLRGLLLAVLAVAALLGWGLHIQRRQLRAVERLEREDIYFGFQVDQGLPHCLRQWLPGGRLRAFDRITWVSAGGPRCLDEQLAALAELRDVCIVEIMSNEIRDGALKYLAGLRHLTWLNLSGPTHIGDDGVAYLRDLRRLKRLNLTHCDITDRSMLCLAQLAELEALNVAFCRVSDVGITRLSGLQQLRELFLTESDTSDASVPVLIEFRKLKLLDLRGTRITRQGIDHLKQALPACKVFGP